jgi:methylmalonyl-CoA/ethylmalonyl-CoA epimerase
MVNNLVSELQSINEVDHIGFAVPNLKNTVAFYEKVLGCYTDGIRNMPEDGIAIAFVKLQNLRLELIQPIGKTSPLTDLLEEYTINQYIQDHPQGGIHHICYRVNDLNDILDRIDASGGRILGNGKPRLGADGNPIIFLDPKGSDGALIELKQN